MEFLESEFAVAAEILKGHAITTIISPIRVGSPGLEIMAQDEDGNEFKFSAFHGGSKGTMYCFGRNQKFDVVTGINIARAFLRRL